MPQVTTRTTRRADRAVFWVAPALGLVMLVVALVATALLRYEHRSLAVWWPPAGLGLAVLARSPRSWWRYEVAATVVSMFGLILVDGDGLVFGTAWALGAGVECLVAARVFRGPRSRDRAGTDRPPEDLLGSGRDILRLALAALAGTVVVAALLSVVLSIQTSSLLVPLTRVYVGDHLLGVLEMTPLLLLPGRRAWRREVAQVRRNLEWLVQLAASVGAVCLVYIGGNATALAACVVVYPLMWGALRLGPMRAMISVLTVSTIATVATVHGDGPLAHVGPSAERVWILQLSLGLLSLATLVLVLSAQRRQSVLAELVRRSGELADAQDFASIGSWTWDPADDQMRWSSEMFRILREDEATFVPTSTWMTEHVEPGDSERMQEIAYRSATTGEPWDFEYGITRSDGSRCIIRDVGRGELIDGAMRLSGILQDVTASRTAARELASARDHLAGILDGATEQAIIAADLQGRITLFNRGAQRMFGYSEDRAVGMHVSVLHDMSEVVARASEMGVEPGMDVFVGYQLRTGEAETRTWTLIGEDGRRLRVSLTISIQYDENGELAGFIGVGTDVTQEIRAQRALAQSEQRFRLAFDTAPVGMAILDLSESGFGALLQVNPVMCELTGMTSDELLSAGVEDISHPDEAESSASVLARLLGEGASVIQTERRLLRRDGRTVWAQLSLSTVPSDDEKPYAICLIEDVTDRRQAEQLLRHQSQHDPLTGLANRNLLREQLEHAVDAAHATGGRVGVLYIDLDGFKSVNDGAGHAAGDELLCQVADRLRQTVRPDDVVARLGGDEFAVLCADVSDPAALHAIAERVVKTLRAQYVLSDSVHRISASVGVSLSGGGRSAEAMLRSADDAMYEAKHGGKDRLSVWPVAG